MSSSIKTTNSPIDHKLVWEEITACQVTPRIYDKDVLRLTINIISSYLGQGAYQQHFSRSKYFETGAHPQGIASRKA